MAHITPVKLPSSSKTLWFDSNDIDAAKGDDVIVQTARGTEYGTVFAAPFEATPEQLSSLKSALKPVVRLATGEDARKVDELAQRARDMMPEYRALVQEEGLAMRPVSIEILFDGDKAVFYFEADDRVDFRELVRKLASRFKIRVDMRQIGPRDEARMVGGIGHCGQELCCKRLGGEFCPVSIRMAKEQDLSLNPQKISGICGRLMCCLRYEYDAYKDFKSRAPKMGAKIKTPEGEGKVISLDVPKEVVTIQIDADKKIKVPLRDMSKSNEENTRPDFVDAASWERASNEEEMAIFGEASFVTSQFTSADKLGEAKAVHREPSGKKEKRSSRSKDGASGRSSRREKDRTRERDKERVEQQATPLRKRRRSTKLASAESEGGRVGIATSEPTENSKRAQKPTNRENDGLADDRLQTRRSRGRVVISGGKSSELVRTSEQTNAMWRAHEAVEQGKLENHDHGSAAAGDALQGISGKDERGARSTAGAAFSERRRRRSSKHGGQTEHLSPQHPDNRPASGNRDDRGRQEEKTADASRTRRAQRSRRDVHGRRDAQESRGGVTPRVERAGRDATNDQKMRPGRHSSGLRQHSDAEGAAGKRHSRANAGGVGDASEANGTAKNTSARAPERRSPHRRSRHRKNAGESNHPSDSLKVPDGNHEARCGGQAGPKARLARNDARSYHDDTPDGRVKAKGVQDTGLHSFRMDEQKGE